MTFEQLTAELEAEVAKTDTLIELGTTITNQDAQLFQTIKILVAKEAKIAPEDQNLAKAFKTNDELTAEVQSLNARLQQSEREHQISRIFVNESTSKSHDFERLSVELEAARKKFAELELRNVELQTKKRVELEKNRLQVPGPSSAIKSFDRTHEFKSINVETDSSEQCEALLLKISAAGFLDDEDECAEMRNKISILLQKSYNSNVEYNTDQMKLQMARSENDFAIENYKKKIQSLNEKQREIYAKFSSAGNEWQQHETNLISTKEKMRLLQTAFSEAESEKVAQAQDGVKTQQNH